MEEGAWEKGLFAGDKKFDLEQFPEFKKIDFEKYLMEHDNEPDPTLYWNNFKIKFYKPPVGVDQEELERIKSLA